MGGVAPRRKLGSLPKGAGRDGGRAHGLDVCPGGNRGCCRCRPLEWALKQPREGGTGETAVQAARRLEPALGLQPTAAGLTPRSLPFSPWNTIYFLRS